MNRHQQEAKKYLSQAFGLNQRIESKLGQIEDLHDLATKATVTYSDMPRNPNKGHSRLEDAVIQIIELETEINQDMIKLVELKKDIIRRVKAVESAELQTILELRYLSYMRWEEIAIELGYGIDNVFRLHRNALDEIEIPERIQKIKFDTVSLCDNVKMAKAKDEEAVVEESAAAFSVEERRWTDAEKTEEAMCLSGLSQPYGREILSGTPEQSEQ